MKLLHEPINGCPRSSYSSLLAVNANYLLICVYSEKTW